jgi:hypothetical protein
MSRATRVKRTLATEIGTVDVWSFVPLYSSLHGFAYRVTLYSREEWVGSRVSGSIPPVSLYRANSPKYEVADGSGTLARMVPML